MAPWTLVTLASVLAVASRPVASLPTNAEWVQPQQHPGSHTPDASSPNGAATATTDDIAAAAQVAANSTTTSYYDDDPEDPFYPIEIDYSFKLVHEFTRRATTTTCKDSSVLIPNGNKAGLSAGDALPWVHSKIGWWYDWSPNPTTSYSGPVGVPMLWGGGTADATDAARLTAFAALGGTPQWIIGFEEPDCPSGSGSSGMSVSKAASVWNTYLAPRGAAGSLLLSPSMCKQADEDFLTPFSKLISRNWDVTNIHINKLDAAGIQKDLDHYWNTYGKPIWITEFACVNDVNGFVPCTDQATINAFIKTAVDIFENDSRVYAYAYSNGLGLGNVWPMVVNGKFTASGQAYLDAISKYH